jgi:polyisoprenoid-binding protein YceI
MSATATTTTPQGTWSVDPVHSRVEFEVAHNGVQTYRGGFSDYDVRLVGSDDGSVAVEGSAKVASITGQDQLYDHLQSPEFFDAERHPEVKFRSTGVELGDGGELTVKGELTIRDTTREVEAEGRISGPGPDLAGRTVVGVSLATAIDRHDFGLGWNMDLPSGEKVLGDEVSLSVSLELIAEEA